MTGTIASTVPQRGVAAMADEPRDYYDPAWGTYVVENQGIDARGELWDRQLPVMRVFGYLVLGLALVAGLPRGATEPWQPALAVATVGVLAVVFTVMWVRRPIWVYSTRTLAIHGAFQLAAYALLVSLSPGFAVLQLIVYPQVVFSLPVRWSIAGSLFIGAFTGLVIVADAGDPMSALPWLLGSLLVAALVIVMGIWMRLTISQSLERRALISELTAARHELASAEREAAVAEERARLSREIHDTLAQGFASVVAHLEAADASLGSDAGRARGDVRAAAEVARASLAEARTLVWELRPETIADAGLPAAIERIAAAGQGADGSKGAGGQLRDAAGPRPGPTVAVSISGEPRTLHPEVEVTLLRAAQEALANARRHAAASRIDVTLTYFGDQVSLDVVDDGRGFDPATTGHSPGLGLRGMRERAEALGGSLVIESVAGEGTTVAVTLPAIEPPASFTTARQDAAVVAPAAAPAPVRGSR